MFSAIPNCCYPLSRTARCCTAPPISSRIVAVALFIFSTFGLTLSALALSRGIVMPAAGIAAVTGSSIVVITALILMRLESVSPAHAEVDTVDLNTLVTPLPNGRQRERFHTAPVPPSLPCISEESSSSGRESPHFDYEGDTVWAYCPTLGKEHDFFVEKKRLHVQWEEQEVHIDLNSEIEGDLFHSEQGEKRLPGAQFKKVVMEEVTAVKNLSFHNTPQTCVEAEACSLLPLETLLFYSSPTDQSVVVAMRISEEQISFLPLTEREEDLFWLSADRKQEHLLYDSQKRYYDIREVKSSLERGAMQFHCPLRED